MAELWFYTPHTSIGRLTSWVTRGKFSHVSIMHTVADLAVVTEAHVIKGVWCSSRSRVLPPQHKVQVDIDDGWTARWLVNRWGVQYGWVDALAFTVPSYKREADRKGVICTELVRMFLLDAANDAIASRAVISHMWVDRLSAAPAARISPTALAGMLV